MDALDILIIFTILWILLCDCTKMPNKMEVRRDATEEAVMPVPLIGVE